MRALAIALIGTFVLASTAAAAPGGGVGLYEVAGVRTSLHRSAVVATGAAIVEVDHGSVIVSASASDVRNLRRLRYRVTARAQGAAPGAPEAQPGRAAFPPGDGGFHTYPEMADETAAIAAAFPSLVSRISIGTSHEGRVIYALKVSDNAGTDEAEPEVLFTHNQHAREHLTVEMALYLLNELTSKYASDARIRNAVDTREIWIVPSLNPDGSEFDVAGGNYVYWRKNRQPPPSPATAIGTDLNRNWGFQWGCCGGSSGLPSSETYRGPFAFSAPETALIRDFVASRRIGGVQQIRTAIDFHTYSELVLWPYGYTTADTAPGLAADQHSTFVAIGQSMASSNGYTAEQASDLYIADGTIDDWLWGAEGVFAFTFEMYPKTDPPGFYPADELIATQTARNRDAVLRLVELADCPYRAIGKEAQYCASAPPSPPPAPPPPPPGVPPAPPAVPPAPPIAPPPPPPSAATSPLARPLTSRASVAADGSFRLGVTCRASAATRCRGTIALAARLPGGGGRRTTIARRTYLVAAGTRSLTLRLRAPGRRVLRARGTLAAAATVTTRQASGASTMRNRRVQLVRRR